MTERAPRLFFLNNNKSCISHLFQVDGTHHAVVGANHRSHVVELDFVVVEKERNTRAVCRHNTGHITGYSDESENT